LSCNVADAATFCMGNAGGTPTTISIGDEVTIEASRSGTSNPAATQVRFGWTCK